MRVHHVAFRTKKLARLARFYREVVGLRVVRETQRSVWLDAGGTIVMLERAARAEPRVPRASLELVCFAARSKKDLAARRAQVERHARVEGETDYTFYFRDPDGRRVGFSRYRLTARSARPRRTPAD